MRKQLDEYKSKIEFTEQQKQVLIGLLLGDAHLETQNDGVTFRLKYSQSIKRHKEYLLHVYNIFKDWTLQSPSLRDGIKFDTITSGEGIQDVVHISKPYPVKRTDQLYFSTVSLPQLQFYANLFYRKIDLDLQTSCNVNRRKKVVPDEIGKLLTPQGLAYWFMDDGSVKSRQSKGVIFNTQSFTKVEVERLCQELQQVFGLLANPRIQKAKNGNISFQIYISGKSYSQLRDLIYPYILPEMQYKFPSPRVRKSTTC